MELRSLGLYHVVSELAALLRQDAALRAIQSGNALSPLAFDQPTGGITGATIYTVVEAGPNATIAMLEITFDSTSGTGRYMINGQIPTAAGGGIFIPSGAGVLRVLGGQNIRNFRMIAETGQTLTFARMTWV